MKEIIVIVGPTGVGKTKLSIELAKKLDAEIINGDSVSIYKKLDIGSAKPTVEERENIPHHLIDIKEVEELMLTLPLAEANVFIAKLKDSCREDLANQITDLQEEMKSW